MRERQRNRLIQPVLLEPDDILRCRIYDREGGVIHEFTETADRNTMVDTVVTFDVDEPMLGLVDGIGAIFGREQVKGM